MVACLPQGATGCFDVPLRRLVLLLSLPPTPLPYPPPHVLPPLQMSTWPRPAASSQ